MSNTQPTTSSTFAPTPTTSVVNNSPGTQLGESDFLELLVAQMKDQDPTNPTDSSQFMSQLAQFSTLEQDTSINQTVGDLATTTGVTQAVDLIGRNVTYTQADGTSASGVVQSVAVGNGSVTVSVGGQQIEPSAITNVGQAGGDSTSQTGTGGNSNSGGNSQSSSTTTN